MEAEVREIRDHFAQYPPFDNLSDELLDRVAGSVEISYFKAGTTILERDAPNHTLYYIRSGAVEVYLHNGQLYNQLGEGDIFGQFGLLRNHRVRFPVKAIEDTLLYLIPESVFEQLCDEDENFADFVELTGSRLKSTVEQRLRDNDMIATRVRRLITRMPVMIEESASVQDAARLMTEHDVSSVLVLAPGNDEDSDRVFTDTENRQWRLAGMVTDKDLRVRVLAEGAPAQTPLSAITHGRLITIQSDESVNEAMLVMLRNNIQRLPILHRRRPVGVVHLSDIVRYETNNSAYLVSNIFNRSSVNALARLTPEIRAAFVRLVDEGATSQMIGIAMSSVGRSLMRRLIELAEAELGEPPIPYCFMVHGSLARNDQSITTDQDNAMVLHDSFDPDQHDAYFRELAQRVSDGLDACGYPYCKGGIMATNEQWRQPLSQWKRYFETWIARPDPQRLLHSSIFFDLDAVYGEERFVEELQDLVATRAQASPLFLAALARNALSRTPPLGLFRTFVLEQDGKHNNSINIKRRGVAPMNDVIRVHALGVGSRSQNCFERLDDIEQAGALPSGQTDKLRYALEFLSSVRLRHQAYEIKHEHPPDNSIDPEQVSDVDRHNLKEAFQILSNAQKFLRFRYPSPGR
ncbi:MAG: cyclic nucleotide-binding protein [Gammaproteobacteria bacterium]|nr:cyclic nucleotide-binding protein [Gammaproteobacteria bacterium]